MEIRPCPRCRKLVPSEATFCRRCGLCVRSGSYSRACPPPPPPAMERYCSRWASTLAATATAALGAVLALFAVSGPRVASRTPQAPRPAPSTPSVKAQKAADARLEALPGDYTDSRAVGGETRSVSRPRQPGWSAGPAAPTAAFPLPAPRGPQITALSSSRAGAGQQVTIVGTHLRGATKVLFVGHVRGRAEARFAHWDDRRLVIMVPHLGSRPQGASIIITTPDGSAAATPFHYTGR